ncbi:hypothetical protein [Bacillus paranthracis]|uniref:hypothetical protein n=1 Tax=Bacillus cereus group TaxID=86661 RepID=UPI0005DE3C7A|nr:hypothetical protein [Bacillus paranthracis]CKG12493.1 Domain of Uncharacterised Function with PDB structure [Streptococcus pneumoniae]MCU4903556.1 hypothetical protein [Bacillus paranthracis]MDK7472200.1 hypothetical protein [Bacillus paranthracis]MEC3524529.1 hypothetical protein [Bacillus paranthracis]CKG19633.1 Domain of Uncharacterised Function with PDB structure [Bacillus paranthracis]
MMKKSTLILCSLCLGFSMTACEQKKEVKKHTATSSTVMENQKKKSININHFSNINEGMTYKEVKDLIGFEGDLLIEEGVEHSTQIKQIFAWKGSNPTALVEITFLDGKVRSKAQQGLS